MMVATTAVANQTMRAIVQEGYGSADALHLREIPRPTLAEGRVLIRVRAASVNALDWHSVHGGLMIRAVSTLMRQKDEPVRGVDVAKVEAFRSERDYEGLEMYILGKLLGRT